MLLLRFPEPMRAATWPAEQEADMPNPPLRPRFPVSLPTLFTAAWLALVTPHALACPPEGWTVEQLRGLKAAKFKLDDNMARSQLALALVPCLRSPDPELRDGVAFEALSAWLRGGALSGATARELGSVLRVDLARADEAGFGPPFAALALSEVARADRLKALWTAVERDAVVTEASEYLKGIRDYRGFDAKQGWRHGVAHAADLLMQLAMNPVLDRAQLDRILDAVATQVLAGNQHAYVFGEGERLLRPVVFVARRMLHNEAEWTAWFGRISLAAMPPPEGPTSLAALAQRHNARGFFYPLYAALQESGDVEMRKRLMPGLVAAVRSLN